MLESQTGQKFCPPHWILSMDPRFSPQDINGGSIINLLGGLKNPCFQWISGINVDGYILLRSLTLPCSLLQDAHLT